MTWLVLSTAVQLALFVTLAIHSLRGKGQQVPGVPRLLWFVALLTLDPLVVVAYLLFVVVGVAKQAAWRSWLVYGVMLLVAVLRFGPIQVPASGVYPQDSARASGLLPIEMTTAVQYGSANSTSSSSSGRGNGWVIRDALVVGDGHPVSAACVDQVAAALLAVGVSEVRFVQASDALPVEPADLMVSVSVRDESAYDLLAAAHWSGRVFVSMGYRPFSSDTWISAYDKFTDADGSSFEANWRVSSTRLGAVWGAAHYDHVVAQAKGIGASIESLFRNLRHGGMVDVQAEGVDGTFEESEIGAWLQPYSPRAIVRGAGLLCDARQIWKVDLGESPHDALQALAGRFEAAGWSSVRVSDTNRDGWWRLTARRQVDGDWQYVRVLPALDSMPVWTLRPVVDGVEDRPQPPVTQEYVVYYHDRFGEARLRALAERCLDSGEDDYLLRLLGQSISHERYEDWRAAVLAGDAGPSNLLCVAYNDRDRERLEAGAALVEVAAWAVRRFRPGGGDLSDLEELVESAVGSWKLELPKQPEAPSAQVLQRAGVPVLDDAWRQISRLVRQPQAGRASAARMPLARRFVVRDDQQRLRLVQLELVQMTGGPLRCYVDVDGRDQTVRDVSAIGDEAVTVKLDDGQLQLREVDGRSEVRWLHSGG